MRPDRSREEAFLVAAARAVLNEEPSLETLAGVDAPSLDWERLARRATEEPLAPLLYSVSRALPLPVPILDRLRTSWLAGRRQHLLGVEHLRGLLSVFESEGVPVIPLKGPALGEALYRDPGLRPFTDLDVLIHRADLPQALRILSSLGYRHLAAGRPLEFELAYVGAACFVSPSGEPSGLPLDLHWELLTHPGVAPARVVDSREFWDRAVKVEGWSRPTLTLCPEDLLTYLALHWAVHHAFAGLIWKLDLALLLRRHGGTLDWDAIAERAHRWRVRGALYFALRSVQDDFGVGPPPSLLARLRPHGARSFVVDWLLSRRDERLGHLDHVIPLLLMDWGSDVLRTVASGALPAAGWVRCRYGGGSLLRAYLAHYGRLGKICARMMRAGVGAGD